MRCIKPNVMLYPFPRDGDTDPPLSAQVHNTGHGDDYDDLQSFAKCYHCENTIRECTQKL